MRCCWNVNAIMQGGDNPTGDQPQSGQPAPPRSPRAHSSRADHTGRVFPARERREAWIAFLQAWDWEWICTLTFRDGVHPEVANRRFRLFKSKLNRALYGRRWAKKAKNGQGIGWVRAIEYQQRDVIHFHVLLTGVSGLRPRDCAGIWREVRPR